MRIIIVRHGQTIENREEVVQSPMGGTLSRHGICQNRKLARFLKNEKIDIIYSSDAKRTAGTAKEINRFHHLKIHYDKLLHERNLGCFIGGPRRLFEIARDSSGVSKTRYRPKGGETYREMRNRASKFLAKLGKRKENTVLIVTHGGLIKMLIGVIFKIPTEKAYKLRQGNACVNIIENSRNKPKLLRLNYRYHLRKR